MPQRIKGPRKLESVSPRLFEYGNGCWSFFSDEPVHPDLESARRHWREVCPQVWRASNRFHPPRAAGEFDGLTWEGLELLCGSWGWVKDFPLQQIIEALKGDRAAVHEFREIEPDAAAEIANFLGEWLEDLDTVEAEAHRIAESRANDVLFPERPEVLSPRHFGDNP